VLKIEIQDLTIAYCKSKSKKTREVKRKLKKDLENKMRSCDEQLEENTFKKGVSREWAKILAEENSDIILLRTNCFTIQ
jgi:pyruvate formate-lyase activating enzyme-like uncharacterized protein